MTDALRAAYAFDRVCTCGAPTNSTAVWPCPSHPLASQRRASPYGVEVTAPAGFDIVAAGTVVHNVTPEPRR